MTSKIENVFETKMAELEAMSDIVKFANSRIEDLSTRWDVVGKKSQQAKDWRTGELKWEDDEHTVPYFEDEYGPVPIPEEQISSHDLKQIEAFKSIIKKLEKLI